MAVAQTPLSEGYCYFRLWFHSNAEQLELERAGFLSIFCFVAGNLKYLSLDKGINSICDPSLRADTTRTSSQHSF